MAQAVVEAQEDLRDWVVVDDSEEAARCQHVWEYSRKKVSPDVLKGFNIIGMNGASVATAALLGSDVRMLH